MHFTLRALCALAAVLTLLPSGAEAQSSLEKVFGSMGSMRSMPSDVLDDDAMFRRPGSVWENTRQSSAIVVAVIEGRSVVKEKEELLKWRRSGLHRFRDEAFAKALESGLVEVQHVRVLDTLHGNSPRRLLIPAQTERPEADLGPIYEAPAPFSRLAARNPEILFLPKGKAGERYRDLDRRERISPRNPAELEVFREWIAEAVVLQRRGAVGGVSEQEQLSWVARGVARRATRRYALEVLGSRHLPPEQARAVMAGFIHEPTTDETFSSVLGLLDSEASPEFDRVAVGVLATVLGEERKRLPLWSVNALPRLMKRLGLSDAERARVTGRADGSIWPAETFVREAWAALREHRLVPSAPAVPFATSVGSTFESPGYFIQ